MRFYAVVIVIMNLPLGNPIFIILCNCLYIFSIPHKNTVCAIGFRSVTRYLGIVDSRFHLKNLHITDVADRNPSFPNRPHPLPLQY